MSLCLTVEGGSNFLRHPVTFTNLRGQKLVGSIYHSAKFSPLNGGPCIIYLHGNASSQLEGQFLVPNFCPYGIFVFCFDFAGCGCSDGEYVSLGYYEQQDTEFLIDVLNKTFKLGPFVLWGRSMGASTALLVQNPLVLGKVSDSSFTSIQDMCTAIATSMKFPSVFVSMAIWYLRKKVVSVANFNIDEVSPLIASKSPNQVPVVFGHAENDQFIPYEQCKALYSSYNSKFKYIMQLPGGHNSRRRSAWITLGVLFAFEQLGIPSDNVVISECRKLQQSTFHFSSFDAMVQLAPEVNDNTILRQYQIEQHQNSGHPENPNEASEIPPTPPPHSKKKRTHSHSVRSPKATRSKTIIKRRRKRHNSRASMINMNLVHDSSPQPIQCNESKTEEGSVPRENDTSQQNDQSDDLSPLVPNETDSRLVPPETIESTNQNNNSNDLSVSPLVPKEAEEEETNQTNETSPLTPNDIEESQTELSAEENQNKSEANFSSTEEIQIPIPKPNEPLDHTATQEATSSSNSKSEIEHNQIPNEKILAPPPEEHNSESDQQSPKEAQTSETRIGIEETQIHSKHQRASKKVNHSKQHQTKEAGGMQTPEAITMGDNSLLSNVTLMPVPLPLMSFSKSPLSQLKPPPLIPQQKNILN
ncbi:Clan SC, family S9, unassigned serine peptidase [Histomonas meleagridis]|uniref:Clan SC, family S9, unassigned serine peptidase n=1 Tax=Histomonas meleagridis TaxID=135588 RepID=UPI00355A7D36|nr:Clan SC, family S9, unassigned serine peptidase [Histomonas meleagridis]KAH0803016.1 Clan SC, family S9, unassigned serine peptidase [Histomonas meleagridis]